MYPKMQVNRSLGTSAMPGIATFKCAPVRKYTPQHTARIPLVCTKASTAVPTLISEINEDDYMSGACNPTFLGRLASWFLPPPVRFLACWAFPIAALIGVHSKAVVSILSHALVQIQVFVPALQAITQHVNTPMAQFILVCLVSCAGFLVSFVVLPVLDLLLGDEQPDEEHQVERAWYQPMYRFILHVFVVLHCALLVSAAHAVATSPITLLQFLVMALNIACSGGVGFAIAHELVHSSHPTDRVFLTTLLTAFCYNHWSHSHLAHHVQVATSEDPASARYKEPVYKFIPRSMVGNWKDAVRMEMKQMDSRMKGASTLAKVLNSRIVQWISLPTMCTAMFYHFWGTAGMSMFLLSAFGSIMFLEIINYIEHYGLSRKVLTSGKPEKVNIQHSWNSNTLASNSAILRLQRHTDHHMHAQKAYHHLEYVHGAPKLPASYPLMILLALFPPAFFCVMNPRIHIYRMLTAISGDDSPHASEAPDSHDASLVTE